MNNSEKTENKNRDRSKSKRTKGRELAIQMLYSLEMSEDKPDTILNAYIENPYIGKLDFVNDDESSNMEDEKFQEKYRQYFDFAEELFRLAIKNKVQDEDMISKFISKNRTIDRIGIIEKCILRLAISELFQGKTPIYAVIDEYVTMANSFSGEKSASLVKAVLENIKTKFSLGENSNGPK